MSIFSNTECIEIETCPSSFIIPQVQHRASRDVVAFATIKSLMLPFRARPMLRYGVEAMALCDGVVSMLENVEIATAIHAFGEKLESIPTS